MRTTRLPLTVALATLLLSGPARAVPPEGWQLVFGDEFEGTQLDVSKWSTTMEFIGTHGPRYHNEYYLSYTVDEDVIVGDGLLRLRTDRKMVEGRHEAPGVFNYTQGLVSTHDKFSFNHGLIEIRAKFPGGKGLWPCLWLMPQHQGWPPEFDIAEYYGGQRTMHHGLAYGSLYNSRWDSTWDNLTDFESDWHTYSLQWTPERAVWMLDGIVRKTIDADYVPKTDMYLILSNSISSVFGPSGEPDQTTTFPNYFLIDYVRIYQPTPVVPVPAAAGIETAELTLAAPATPPPAEIPPPPERPLPTPEIAPVVPVTL